MGTGLAGVVLVPAYGWAGSSPSDFWLPVDISPIKRKIRTDSGSIPRKVFYPQPPSPSYFRTKIAQGLPGSREHAYLLSWGSRICAAQTITQVVARVAAKITTLAAARSPTAPHPARIFRQSMRKWSYVSHQ